MQPNAQASSPAAVVTETRLVHRDKISAEIFITIIKNLILTDLYCLVCTVASAKDHFPNFKGKSLYSSEGKESYKPHERIE